MDGFVQFDYLVVFYNQSLSFNASNLRKVQWFKASVKVLAQARDPNRYQSFKLNLLNPCIVGFVC